jgi:hypothetical protein
MCNRTRAFARLEFAQGRLARCPAEACLTVQVELAARLKTCPDTTIFSSIRKIRHETACSRRALRLIGNRVFRLVKPDFAAAGKNDAGVNSPLFLFNRGA